MRLGDTHHASAYQMQGLTHVRYSDRNEGGVVRLIPLNDLCLVAEGDDGHVVFHGKEPMLQGHVEVVRPEPCPVPPAGWRCTRGAGHDGPCAALPVSQTLEAPAVGQAPSVAPWASRCSVVECNSRRECFARFTDADGIYHFLEPITRKWLPDGEQRDMALFLNAAEAQQAIDNSTTPPTWPKAPFCPPVTRPDGSPLTVGDLYPNAVPRINVFNNAPALGTSEEPDTLAALDAQLTAERAAKEFPLSLNPDGTDSLYCRECESRVEDGESGRHKGDSCPFCVPGADTNDKEGDAVDREIDAYFAGKPSPRINIRCETSDGHVHGSTTLNVVRVEQEDDGSFTAVTDHWPDVQHNPAPPPDHSVPEGFAAQVLETVRNRGGDYGTPADNHQLTADIFSSWLSRRLKATIKLSAEDVIMLNVLQKASRLAYSSKDDSWLDIAGYSENVAMIRKDQRNGQR